MASERRKFAHCAPVFSSGSHFNERIACGESGIRSKLNWLKNESRTMPGLFFVFCFFYGMYCTLNNDQALYLDYL